MPAKSPRFIIGVFVVIAIVISIFTPGLFKLRRLLIKKNNLGTKNIKPIYYMRISNKNVHKFGKVIKIYTQIGYENHGKDIAVILLYDSYLRFYEAEIEMMNPAQG